MQFSERPCTYYTCIAVNEIDSLSLTGEDSTLNSVNSVHLDAFLYDEDGEEALVQEGLLARWVMPFQYILLILVM